MTTRDREPGQLSDWGVLGFGVLAGIAVVALLVAAYAIGASKGRSDALEEASTTVAATAPPPAPTTEANPQAISLFSTTCGGCHTLAAAGTTATVGPNLDELQPTVEQVLAAIENGGAGTGQMPAGLLSGAEAESVAAFVAGAAGR